MTNIKTVRERTSVPSQLAGIVAVLVPPLGLAAAVWLLWNRGARPVDLILLAGFYVACGLGITVGFHRLFTHKSFETIAPFRAVWAILGSMAMRGLLTQWVTDHRKLHALSDRPGDPHSPHAGHGDSLAEHIFGLWHSHIGWLFSTKGLERGVDYGRDLYMDRLVRAIDRLYLLWVALTLGLPFLAGYLVGGTWQRGLEAMVWAGLVRIFLVQHVTFSINSICHFGLLTERIVPPRLVKVSCPPRLSKKSPSRSRRGLTRHSSSRFASGLRGVAGRHRASGGRRRASSGWGGGSVRPLRWWQSFN